MNETRRPAWLRMPGEEGEALARRVRERLDDRIGRGVVTTVEIDRVTGTTLALFDDGDAASEAFRRCCVAFEVDRFVPLTSHRPIVGPLIVAAKKTVRRLLRFQNEAAWARQREFNEGVLRVMRELLRRSRRDG